MQHQPATIDNHRCTHTRVQTDQRRTNGQTVVATRDSHATRVGDDCRRQTSECDGRLGPGRSNESARVHSPQLSATHMLLGDHPKGGQHAETRLVDARGSWSRAGGGREADGALTAVRSWRRSASHTAPPTPYTPLCHPDQALSLLITHSSHLRSICRRPSATRPPSLSLGLASMQNGAWPQYAYPSPIGYPQPAHLAQQQQAQPLQHVGMAMHAASASPYSDPHAHAMMPAHFDGGHAAHPHASTAAAANDDIDVSHTPEAFGYAMIISQMDEKTHSCMRMHGSSLPFASF